jgi:hypothetical protein
MRKDLRKSKGMKTLRKELHVITMVETETVHQNELIRHQDHIIHREAILRLSDKLHLLLQEIAVVETEETHQVIQTGAEDEKIIYHS